MQVIVVLLALLLSHYSFARGRLLSTLPQAYSTYPGFNQEPSTCHDLIAPTKAYLMKLKRQGHQVALMMNNGSNLPVPDWRVLDQFQGTTYGSIHQLVEAMEKHAGRGIPGAHPDLYRGPVRRCLHGQKQQDRHGRNKFPEPCVTELKARYMHTGFAMLNPGTDKEPFMIHLYGDENYDFLRSSIRVESLDSYLEEDKMGVCESKILTLAPSTQNRIMEFFAKDLPLRVLASGTRNYNLLTNPWSTRSQNCNAWVSEVLATSLFLSKRQWGQINRVQAKQMLAQTGFRPVKVSFGNLHALTRLVAPFIGGISTEEGNIIHAPYNVADVLPSLSIEEWLESHGLITSETTIYGRY